MKLALFTIFCSCFEDEIETLMRSYGLKMEVVLTRRSGPEHLSVLKFTWTT